MSGITVLSPVGINQVKAQSIAPRLESLERVKVGILNNSKPNSLALQGATSRGSSSSTPATRSAP